MKKDKLKPRRRFIGFKEELEQRKLIQAADYRNGKAHEQDITEDGDFVVINSKFVSTNGEVKKYSDTQIEPMTKGEIAFVLSDVPNGRAIARTFLVDADNRYSLNQRIAGITPHKDTNSYFLNILMNRNSYFLRFDDGVKQTNLSKKDVENFVALYPSIEEQNKIGLFFSNLDKTITLQQRKLEKLQELKKAYLHEMFPTEDENTPKRRFSGFTDDWEQCKLSELATMNARIGWQNLRTSEFLDSGDYMLITGTDFNDGIVNYSTVHYIKKERYDQDKKIQVQNGSILITKDGTLGKVAYVQDLSMPATLNAGVFNVRVIDDSLVDAMYLFHYLSAPFLMDYVTRIATGGTIKHLNQNILVNFPVLLPKIEEQKLISKFLDNLSTTITLQQRKIEKLQKLKQAYLNDMFV